MKPAIGGMFVLTLLGAAQVAGAQRLPADQLFVTGQAAVVGETAARGGGVEWLHPASEKTTLDVGGFMGTSTGGWFTYARLGAIAWRTPLIFSGAVDIGGGREGARAFPYTRFRAELGVPVRTTRALAQAEVDHIRVAGHVVTGLRFGGVFQLTSRLSTQVSAHAYASGDDVTPAGSLRGDYATGRWRVLAGMFISRRPAAGPTPVEISPMLSTTRTSFVGIQVRAGAQDLVGVLDISEQPRGRVATLLLSLRVPLQ